MNIDNDPPVKIFARFKEYLNLKKDKPDLLQYCINHSKSDYFLPRHVYILLNHYSNIILIKELDLLYKKDINKYNDFYEKIFLYPWSGSEIYWLETYDSYGYDYNNKNLNFISACKSYKGNITNKNIYKIVAFGNILYDDIKKYYENNICTHNELYIIIIRFQLKYLVNIPSVAKTLYKAIVDSKFPYKSSQIILHDIISFKNIKEFRWNPLTFFEIENLYVLLDNKVKITTEMMEIFINTIGYDKYKYYDNDEPLTESIQNHYRYRIFYHKNEFVKNYIKIIVDKCILSGAKLKYSSFINLLMLKVEYEDFHKYGIQLQDNISELFIDSPIPEFIVKHGITISDNTLVKYFTKHKNYSENEKYMKKHSLKYSESCLKGIVTNCKKNSYSTINKLIIKKGLKVSPDVIKAYITTSGNNAIGTLLWDEFIKSYDIIKKT